MTTRVGFRAEFLEPGVVVWHRDDVAAVETAGTDDAFPPRGGVVVDVVVELELVVAARDGSRDFRDRHRGGIALARIPWAEVHWCPPEQGPCTYCPAPDPAWSRRIGRRLLRLVGIHGAHTAASRAGLRDDPLRAVDVELVELGRRVLRGVAL